MVVKAIIAADLLIKHGQPKISSDEVRQIFLDVDATARVEEESRRSAISEQCAMIVRDVFSALARLIGCKDDQVEECLVSGAHAREVERRISRRGLFLGAGAVAAGSMISVPSPGFWVSNPVLVSPRIYSWSSIEISIDGHLMQGFETIHYKEMVDKGRVVGVVAKVHDVDLGLGEVEWLGLGEVEWVEG